MCGLNPVYHYVIIQLQVLYEKFILQEEYFGPYFLNLFSDLKYDSLSG